MTRKITNIITATHDTFKKMCQSLLTQIKLDAPILKITFFGAPKDNSEYLVQLYILHEETKSIFKEGTPLISYVAQKPMTGQLKAEMLYASNDPDTIIERKRGYILITKGNECELITEGIISDDLSSPIYYQSEDVFNTLTTILNETGFKINDIYRQWNYIENITGIRDERQNYQEFNDARSVFYTTTKWTNGYPAATGIGTSCGGIMVEINAIKGNKTINKPINNPLQISAHSYSQEVLIGELDEKYKEKTTPKFERARLVGETVYISGTASIKGEETVNIDDAVGQAETTMEIMDNLVSKENLKIKKGEVRYESLRVYVKNIEDVKGIKQFMNKRYPEPLKYYLIGDVCRQDLLVEIEGMATINKN